MLKLILDMTMETGGMFEGGICHVKITQTFAKQGEGFLFTQTQTL